MNRALSTVLATVLLGSVALPAEAAKSSGVVRQQASASRQKLAVNKAKIKIEDGKRLAGKAKAPAKMKLSVADSKTGKSVNDTKSGAKMKLAVADTAAVPKVSKGGGPKLKIAPVEAQPVVEAQVSPPPLPVAKGPGLGRRMIIGLGHAGASLGRSVGNFLARQVQMRPEMKLALGEAKALRKDGQLTAAAETLRDAPKASGAWERFRAWRGKRAVMGGAKKQLLAKKLDSDPAEGYAAFSTLNDAKMSSWLERRSANKALSKGAVNAIRTASKLGDKGRYEDAYQKLEWSLGERGQMDQNTVAVTQKLVAQAMKGADRAAIRFEKARSPADKAAFYEQALMAFDMSGVFNEMQGKATGNSLYDGERGGRVIQRLGLTEKTVGPAIEALMAKKYGQPVAAPSEPTAQQTPAAGEQLSFNF